MPFSEKPRPVSPSPYPRLTPVLSHLSRYQSPPPRDDGLDNFPAPLPHDPVELQRQLTAHPEIEAQMADDDVGPPPEGGREAWACVLGAFFVLFCIFGFSESTLLSDGDRGRALTAATTFGQLQVYYLDNQLKDYSKSEVA
jgi:hypothetical protein